MTNLGGECVLASEIDEYAIQTYKENYGIDSAHDMRKIKTDIQCAYTRHLDSKNTRSPSQTFYTDKALVDIKAQYEAAQS